MLKQNTLKDYLNVSKKIFDLKGKTGLESFASFIPERIQVDFQISLKEQNHKLSFEPLGFVFKFTSYIESLIHNG